MKFGCHTMTTKLMLGLVDFDSAPYDLKCVPFNSIQPHWKLSVRLNKPSVRARTLVHCRGKFRLIQFKLLSGMVEFFFVVELCTAIYRK